MKRIAVLTSGHHIAAGEYRYAFTRLHVIISLYQISKMAKASQTSSVFLKEKWCRVTALTSTRV
jgi:hypothetical protein